MVALIEYRKWRVLSVYGYAENSGYKWMPKVSEVYRLLLAVSFNGPSKRIAGESMTFLRKTALASEEFRHKYTTHMHCHLYPIPLYCRPIDLHFVRTYRSRSSFWYLLQFLLCKHRILYTLLVATGRWQIVSWV